MCGGGVPCRVPPVCAHCTLVGASAAGEETPAVQTLSSGQRRVRTRIHIQWNPYIYIHGIRQKEWNKCAAVALTSAAYCAQRLTLFQGLRRFSKDCGAFPRIAVLFQGLRCFSKDCGAFPRIVVLFQGLWCFSKDCGAFPRIAVLFQGLRCFSKDCGAFPRIVVLFQGLRCFSKDCGAFPRIAVLFQGLRCFSKDCGAFPRIAVLFQGLWCFSKDCGAFPRIAVLFQGLRRFSKDCGAFPVKLRRVRKNRGTFGKKRHNILPAQIQRQTIKVWQVSYQKVAQKFFISVAFFLTYTVHV